MDDDWNNTDTQLNIEERDRIIKAINDMDIHCHMLYSQAYDLLKERGMTDDEILKTNMHLHSNSTNVLSNLVRVILLHL